MEEAKLGPILFSDFIHSLPLLSHLLLSHFLWSPPVSFVFPPLLSPNVFATPDASLSPSISISVYFHLSWVIEACEAAGFVGGREGWEGRETKVKRMEMEGSEKDKSRRAERQRAETVTENRATPSKWIKTWQLVLERLGRLSWVHRNMNLSYVNDMAAS